MGKDELKEKKENVSWARWAYVEAKKTAHWRGVDQLVHALFDTGLLVGYSGHI